MSSKTTRTIYNKIIEQCETQSAKYVTQFQKSNDSADQYKADAFSEVAGSLRKELARDILPDYLKSAVGD